MAAYFLKNGKVYIFKKQKLKMSWAIFFFFFFENCRHWTSSVILLCLYVQSIIRYVLVQYSKIQNCLVLKHRKQAQSILSRCLCKVWVVRAKVANWIWICKGRMLYNDILALAIIWINRYFHIDGQASEINLCKGKQARLMIWVR